MKIELGGDENDRQNAWFSIGVGQTVGHSHWTRAREEKEEGATSVVGHSSQTRKYNWAQF
jgi:hypothetical protein